MCVTVRERERERERVTEVSVSARPFSVLSADPAVADPPMIASLLLLRQHIQLSPRQRGSRD